MNTKEKKLIKRIELLKQRILKTEEVYPGSITKQYNVCGKKDCRCKDEKSPKRHGPYNKLSFTFKGRGKTKFIKDEEVEEFKRYTSNYKKFRQCCDDFVEANIELIELRREYGNSGKSK